MPLEKTLHAIAIVSPELVVVICTKSLIDFGKQKRNCPSSGEELRPDPSQRCSGVSGQVEKGSYVGP